MLLGTPPYDRVVRSLGHLLSRFRSERVEGEVSDAALLVLIVLDKQDRMSLSDLAETAKVTLGSMSQTVRRLEQLAYVTKSRGTEDRNPGTVPGIHNRRRLREGRRRRTEAGRADQSVSRKSGGICRSMSTDQVT